MPLIRWVRFCFAFSVWQRIVTATKDQLHKMPESIHNLLEATSIGGRIRWLREMKGLTLKQFAARLGCDSGYLSKLETGKATNPTPRFLVHLSMTFFVNANWVIHGAGHPFGRSGEIVEDSTVFRVFAVLDDLPAALDANRVLELLLKDYSLEDIQSLWSEVRSLPGLPTTAVHFWNTVFTDAQFPKMRFGQENKKQSMLDIPKSIANTVRVKTEVPAIQSLPELLKAVRSRVQERGQKTALAKRLHVSRQAVDQWLSGDAKPSADLTFELLKWVQQ